MADQGRGLRAQRLDQGQRIPACRPGLIGAVRRLAAGPIAAHGRRDGAISFASQAGQQICPAARMVRKTVQAKDQRPLTRFQNREVQAVGADGMLFDGHVDLRCRSGWRAAYAPMETEFAASRTA